MQARLSSLILSGFSALAAVASPSWAQEAPVRSVTLFEAGLAEITREIGIQDRIVLQIPLRDVNDVLKSLLLRGGGIEGARVTLDGAHPVEDAFASLPFPPSAATDMPALLRSVPGLSVRVSDRAYPQGHEGRLIDVTENCTDEGGCETVLTILGEGNAISRHVFDENLQLVILDEAIADALSRGLGVLRQAASGTVREVAIELQGARIRDGALTYVVAAPAWKTAYRALVSPDGAVTVQGWAVVENATGADWSDVALTLSSGSPNTLTADLHGRSWQLRDEAGKEVPPMAMEAAMADAQQLGAVAARMAPAAPPPAPVQAAATGAEGMLDSRFTISEPIDLASGEMISLPFLSDSFAARQVSLYRGGLQTRTGNPEMVLDVTNSLDVRLPAGIATVFTTEGGYVGDADLPLVAPGDTREVAFGWDRRLRVEETVTLVNRLATVRAFRGQIRVTHDSIRTATYAVSSPAAVSRDVLIDHPVEDGWTAEVVAGRHGTMHQDDDGRRWLRIPVDFTAAEGDDAPSAAGTVVIRDSRPLHRLVALNEFSPEMILEWRGHDLDAETEAFLDGLARFAAAVSEARQSVSRHEAAQERLEADQARIRALVESVPGPSEAHDQFLANLLALEARIVAAAGEVEASLEAQHAAEDALATFLAGS